MGSGLKSRFILIILGLGVLCGFDKCDRKEISAEHPVHALTFCYHVENGPTEGPILNNGDIRDTIDIDFTALRIENTCTGQTHDVIRPDVLLEDLYEDIYQPPSTLERKDFFPATFNPRSGRGCIITQNSSFQSKVPDETAWQRKQRILREMESEHGVEDIDSLSYTYDVNYNAFNAEDISCLRPKLIEFQRTSWNPETRQHEVETVRGRITGGSLEGGHLRIDAGFNFDDPSVSPYHISDTFETLLDYITSTEGRSSEQSPTQMATLGMDQGQRFRASDSGVNLSPQRSEHLQSRSI